MPAEDGEGAEGTDENDAKAQDEAAAGNDGVGEPEAGADDYADDDFEAAPNDEADTGSDGPSVRVKRVGGQFEVQCRLCSADKAQVGLFDTMPEAVQAAKSHKEISHGTENEAGGDAAESKPAEPGPQSSPAGGENAESNQQDPVAEDADKAGGDTSNEKDSEEQVKSNTEDQKAEEDKTTAEENNAGTGVGNDFEADAAGDTNTKAAGGADGVDTRPPTPKKLSKAEEALRAYEEKEKVEKQQCEERRERKKVAAEKVRQEEKEKQESKQREKDAEAEAKNAERQAEFDKQVAAASAKGLLQVPPAADPTKLNALIDRDAVLLYAAYADAITLPAKSVELKRLDEAATAAENADAEAKEKFDSDTKTVEEDYARDMAEYETKVAAARLEHGKQLEEWEENITEARKQFAADEDASWSKYVAECEAFEAKQAGVKEAEEQKQLKEVENANVEKDQRAFLFSERQCARAKDTITAKAKLSKAKAAMDIPASRAAKKEIDDLQAVHFDPDFKPDMLEIEEKLCSFLRACLKSRREKNERRRAERQSAVDTIVMKLDACRDLRHEHTRMAKDHQEGWQMHVNVRRLQALPCDPLFETEMKILEDQLYPFRHSKHGQKDYSRPITAPAATRDAQASNIVNLKDNIALMEAQLALMENEPEEPDELVPGPLPPRPDMKLADKAGPEPVKADLPEACPPETATAARRELAAAGASQERTRKVGEACEDLIISHTQSLIDRDDYDNADKSQASWAAMKADNKAFRDDAEAVALLKRVLREAQVLKSHLVSPGADVLLAPKGYSGFKRGWAFGMHQSIAVQPVASNFAAKAGGGTQFIQPGRCGARVCA